ncbi:TnsA endonuclease N-terminal domain-containing protein [Caenispirillum salinarum]|uniref:TnsA endonuclease N-terminal domain-containing protein n=1 Tax=Caenispirillum salinarum TaxID=859058 RepID=UPI00384E7F48
MPRFHTAATEARRLEAGFGRGKGAAYRPWVSVRDVKGGICSRASGWRSGRLHHLMSRLEYDVLLFLQWPETVEDIREQVPLATADTAVIADAVGVRHPVSGGDLIVQTTDFLVLRRAGGIDAAEAIAVKPADRLANRRTLEKLEIERRYWTVRGVRWSLVTDRELPEDAVRMLRWIESDRRPPADTASRDELLRREAAVHEAVSAPGAAPVAARCAAADAARRWPAGTALALVRVALARKWWLVGLRRPLLPDRPPPAVPRDVARIEADGVEWRPDPAAGEAAE